MWNVLQFCPTHSRHFSLRQLLNESSSSTWIRILLVNFVLHLKLFSFLPEYVNSELVLVVLPREREREREVTNQLLRESSFWSGCNVRQGLVTSQLRHGRGRVGTRGYPGQRLPQPGIPLPLLGSRDQGEGEVERINDTVTGRKNRPAERK